MTDRPTREEIARIRRDAAAWVGGSRNDRALLLAEIDALTAENVALREDAGLWRDQQAEIEADWERAGATLAANDAVRALPEAERRAAILAGAGEIWTDEEHARMREVAATMPVFVRVCQEKREALARAEQAERERDEAQAALVALRERLQVIVAGVIGAHGDTEAGFMRGVAQATLAAKPATLAGQVEARVLRRAADAYDTGGRISTEAVREWLRALADEAEKGGAK